MTLTTTFEEKIARPVGRTACYHCGDDCPSHPVQFSEKPFCCEGCKTVFEILNANDLCQFYRIDRTAAFSLKGRRQENYAWLDDPETAEKLLDFTDGKTSKITFQLPQIHCASCVWLLENLYKLSPGILASKVNFLKKEAYVTFAAGQVSLRKVVELLASIGYAPDLHLGSLERRALPLSRRLIFQLGVAGFAFGNIMLLSFPEYLGLETTEGWFRQLFGYVNLLLATPVAFYSGRDYLNGAWHALRKRSTSIDIPLALGIVVLYFRSAFEVISGTGAGYFDSLAGLVFFLLIGKWFQQVTYHRIHFDRDYKAYFPVAATRIGTPTFRSERRSDLKVGVPENVPVHQLEIGDTILVRNREIIPADGILKRGAAHIDYSFVTGESVPVERQPGEKIFAGGRQTGEAIELILTKKVSQSYLTQLWNEDAFGEAFQQNKLGGASRLANRVSRYFTLSILAIAFATLAYWLPKDARTAFNAFTAVLIIACPCAAALNVPFTLGNTLRILARRGFFLKNTNVAEALHCFSVAVFDKTGTLSVAAGNELRYEGELLTEEENDWLRTLAGQSSHPISRQLAAIPAHDFNRGTPSPRFQSWGEIIDFQEFTGQGIEGKVAGQRLRIGSKAFIGYAGTALADANVFVEINGVVKGGFLLQNRYRPSAWEVVSWFKNRSKTFLLSGDNERERALLDGKFSGELHFRQSPKDKLDFIKNLQSGGEKVLMLGDGLNDAGALRQADVGMVVAEDANNFTPACDAILDARQFSQLPRFLAFIKKSIHVVYAAWALAALYNVVGLSYAVQGELSPVVAAILMPASSLTIVAFGVGMTSLLMRVDEG